MEPQPAFVKDEPKKDEVTFFEIMKMYNVLLIVQDEKKEQPVTHNSDTLFSMSLLSELLVKCLLFSSTAAILG